MLIENLDLVLTKTWWELHTVADFLQGDVIECQSSVSTDRPLNSDIGVFLSIPGISKLVDSSNIVDESQVADAANVVGSSVHAILGLVA